MKTYIYANSQIIAQHTGDHSASRYFFLHDRLGSVRLVMDTSGDVQNRYIYDPFGNIHENDDDFEEQVTACGSFRFTGQFFDSEIEQYYLRARQYYPYIGRFTSRDPVLGQFEDPVSLHKYLYCGNNPINFVDLDGEWAIMLGGSLSANINLTHEFLVENFGLMGYYLGLLPLMCETVAQESLGVGVGGTGGAGVFFGKNTEDTGWFNLKGWFGGTIQWTAGGISLASAAGASLTFDIGVFPYAQKAEELEGAFTEVGGSVTVPAPVSSIFWFVTGGVTYGVSDKGTELYTVSVGPAWTTWGTSWEAHWYKGHATVQEW